MTAAITRYMRMDDWIFEVKTVRALKVDSYGQPYQAIAQLNLNGDIAFVDGALHASEQQFSQQDIDTFTTMCQRLKVKSIKFDQQLAFDFFEQSQAEEQGSQLRRHIA